MQTKTINLEEAVGKVLYHDLTKVVRGEFKGPAFRKGHVICLADIDELLKMGKENICISEIADDELHEDEAGIRLGKAAAAAGVYCSEPKESKVNLYAEHNGLLKVNFAALAEVNDLPEAILSTLPNNTPVTKGEMVAGTKVIPLAVKEDIILAAEEICRKSGGIISVEPFQTLKAAIIVTGSEVYYGRIKDEFGPVLKNKIESFGSTVLEIEYVDDDALEISRMIKEAIDRGANLVLISGGMSVDPDDVTPLGIRLSGAVIEKYGAPVLPGAMFLLAYSSDVAILGVPACGMFFKTTILDLILPRLFAKEKVKRHDIVALAHGGLCRNCPECRYPGCSFGSAGSGFQFS